MWLVICYIRKRQTPGSFIPINKSDSKNQKIFYLGDGGEENLEEQKKVIEERERSKQQSFLATYYRCLESQP